MALISPDRFFDLATVRIRRHRALARYAAEIHTREFWRALNPNLTLTDGPVALVRPLRPLDPPSLERAARQLGDEGYAQLPPIIDPADVAELRASVQRIVATGLPETFIWVYDEPYGLFARIGAALESIIGPDPWLLPREIVGFCVEPGDPSWTRWSAFEPHRDWLGGDPGVLAHGRPTVLSFWIPLTDVTPLDSCIHVVPAPGDPDYDSPEEKRDWSAIRLQDIRALPAGAGSVLVWTTHLIHWGSRSSRHARGPRVSIAVDLQRRDVAPFDIVRDLGGALPFADRVQWVLGKIGLAADSEAPGEEHA